MKAWWKGCAINVKQPQILTDSNIYLSLNVIVQRRQSVQSYLQWDSLSLDSVTILEGAHYSDSPFWTSWFPSQGLNIFLQNDPLINCHLESLHCRITIISTHILVDLEGINRVIVGVHWEIIFWHHRKWQRTDWNWLISPKSHFVMGAWLQNLQAKCQQSKKKITPW